METTIVIIVIAVVAGIIILRRSGGSDNNTPQPSASVTPTPTPTLSTPPSTPPDPTDGRIPDVSVDSSNAAFVSMCNQHGGPVSVPQLRSSLSIDHPRSNYQITYDGCYSTQNAVSLCSMVSVNVTGDGTEAEIVYPGTVYDRCPRESNFHDANFEFTITDLETGFSVKRTLSVYWEIA